ncbi:TPA: glycosyl transferase family 2 [Citrobacter freundii]|uniref:glycosyl transferase family 2 n=1 Tax=Citrobacter freundii TaxID=546 RepID=UPI000D039B10|nr:glycosyl transferase family 2 [Citrobacter freundii]MBE0004253.1 glycosyl transferase family 2 [Citrobacter freundii]MBJ8787022.1 glycosyl transferase family 2 [Citrobacter freundii]MDV0656859.1 glycosyl transferase family 2 [Citrobacter freundii]MDV0722434.1 glycosyl transferase family 2 [Citrobacter freundii]MEB0617215.1 glycosyl transferase family 2 [Citrobacter freundii]
MKSESFVSVVIVIPSHLNDIYNPLSELAALLDKQYSDYELVVIAPGLDSTNAETEDRVLKNIPCVRIIQLSTPVFHDVSLAAGLESAIGDFVVLWNPLSDPIDVVPQSVNKCREGADVVVGVSNCVRSLRYRMLRRLMNVVLRTIDYDIPPNSTGLRCLSRRAVNAVTRIGRFHHQFYLRIHKTGYPAGVLTYTPTKESEGAGVVKSLRRLMRLVIFNSSRPLRWMSVLGFGGSVAGFLFACYSVLIHLFSGLVVEGWTTTILVVTSLFIIQFVMMAFFGEYLGRLLDESSAQAEYAVVYERTSDVMVNVDRINVMHTSLPPEINNVQTGRDGLAAQTLREEWTH